MKGSGFGRAPFRVPHLLHAYCVRHRLWVSLVEPTTHHPPKGAHIVLCDCDATPEDIAAGIHNEPCTSRDTEPDDPSDHYGL